MENKLKYKRVLIKISGEALLGEQQFGIDQNPVRMIAEEIKKARDLGAQIAVVVGGGNIFRGMKNSAKLGMDQCICHCSCRKYSYKLTLCSSFLLWKRQPTGKREIRLRLFRQANEMHGRPSVLLLPKMRRFSGRLQRC